MLQRVSLLLGPLSALAVGLTIVWSGEPSPVAWTGAIAVVCAVWWIAEPIPIAATALLPIALFPLLGILSPEQVAQAYGHKLILLLLGGFMLSTAMERSGAHRRLAIGMIRLFGGQRGGRRLVLGFMFASAGLSMWISNTATTLMLLPIAMAIVEGANDQKLRVPLLLGIAYAASIGGIGTPIGTPPNLVFMDNYQQVVGQEPSFLQWMAWSVPIALVMLPLAGLWLTRGHTEGEEIQLPDPGPWRSQEVRTLCVFALTALLWITRIEPFGGWSHWTGLTSANDASVALLAVLAMFLIPSGIQGQSGATTYLLDWESVQRIPWGLLILFSGGLTLAKAFVVSGLSTTLGSQLAEIGNLPPLLLVAAVCLMITFLTEVTSNLATASLLLPVLAAMSLESGIDPKLIMVPATLSASFAFMLPVATAPNAIVYGAGGFHGRLMAREGFALNLIGVAVVTLASYFLMH